MSDSGLASDRLGQYLQSNANVIIISLHMTKTLGVQVEREQFQV